MERIATTVLPPHAGGRKSLRPQDGRRSNLALVLQSLYEQPQLTRAALARHTGLTKVTISDLVAELIEAGLVAEVGFTTGTPGKPATILEVREDSRDIISLDLSAPDRITGAVYSLRGTQHCINSVELLGATGERAVQVVLDFAKSLAEQCTHQILGIGVGTPGIVDADGTISSAPNLGWQDVSLQRLLADTLQIPASVSNDANAAVLAERSFADAAPDLVRVQISRGVGAGLLIAGSIVTGPSWAAGEIGHVVVDKDGAACPCGKRGCLETWISAPALTKRIAKNPKSRNKILAEAGNLLGVALAPVVSMLDLTEIVLGGPDEFISGQFLKKTRESLSARTHTSFRREATLRKSTLEDEAVLLGAVALVLHTALGVG